MKVFSLLFFLLPFVKAYSQDLTVPEDILERLETEVVIMEEDTFSFRVAYPENFDAEKTYDCFLGFSGGSQSLKIVNYCYAAWFQSGYFKDYITILPVNRDNDSTSFLDYEPERMERMIAAVKEYFPLNDKWVLGGTSNGGVGAFQVLNMNPEMYKAIIVAPGVIGEDFVLNGSWSHIDVILAYGDKDAKDWIKNSKNTAKRLKGNVKSVQLVALKGQGHILPITFNVDRFYDVYFLKE